MTTQKETIKILIACEFSQVVCKAFRDKGFSNTFSCDIIKTEGNPEWHFEKDVFEILKEEKWDMMIAHPPCTFLANSGVQHIFKEGRLENMQKAEHFFLELLYADIKFVAVENPVPHKYTHLPPYTQIIQPYQFGDEVSKRTCLWLRNLPKLLYINVVSKGERYIKNGKSNGSKWFQCHSGGTNHSKNRSRTFPGIANAMAEQWGNYILQW